MTKWDAGILKELKTDGMGRVKFGYITSAIYQIFVVKYYSDELGLLSETCFYV
jgi:hypothetical protein